MPRIADRTAHALGRTALLSAGMLLLAGCSLAGPQQPAQHGDASPHGAREAIPPTDQEGYDPLTVHLVSPVAAAPPGTTGTLFGCQDLLVAVQTVPTDAEDRADTAVDFLLEDLTVDHGAPALSNAVAASRDTLTYTGHHRDGDTEVFEFSGTVAVQTGCEAQRFRAQLQQTALTATDADRVRLTVDGEDLDDVLQLPPLVLGKQYTAPEAADGR